MKRLYDSLHLLFFKMNKKSTLFRFQNYNIADWISVFRIFVVPVLLTLILLDQKSFFSWLLLISFFSDMVDGIIARYFKLTSSRGARLDSIGDICILIMSLAGIVKFEMDFLEEYYILLLLTIGFYLVELMLSIWKYGKLSSFHTYLSKTAMLLQGIFILSLLLLGYFPWLFYAAISVTIISVIEELIILMLLPTPETNVKGLYWILKRNK